MPKWFRPVGAVLVATGSGLMLASGADPGSVTGIVGIAASVVAAIFTLVKKEDE